MEIKTTKQAIEVLERHVMYGSSYRAPSMNREEFAAIDFLKEKGVCQVERTEKYLKHLERSRSELQRTLDLVALRISLLDQEAKDLQRQLDHWAEDLPFTSFPFRQSRESGSDERSG